MKNLWWLLPVGLLGWWLWKKKQTAGASAQPSKAVQTTGTATTAPEAFWKGWDGTTSTALKKTTQGLQAAAQVKDTLTGVVNYFSAPPPAQGSASVPSTNGSGAGQPDGAWDAQWNF